MATRLYLHAAYFDEEGWGGGTFPDANGDTQIVITNPQPSFGQTGADAMSVHRSMNTTKGNSETTKAITRTTVNGTTESSWICKFISDPLSGITSISANTWVTQWAIAENNSSSNIGGIMMTLYVWRPSTNARVGGQNIYDGNVGSSVLEPASINTERLVRGNHTSGAGRAISGVEDGDVLIFEAFIRKTPSAAASMTDTFYFDGSTEYDGTTNGSIVSDIASYIETPQNLTFGEPPPAYLDMTNASTKSIRDIELVKAV